MPAENAGRAFALVLVDELVRQGMRHAVVAPGSRSTPIALALLENPAITVHVRVDERSAAYLALGVAKVSRAIVAVLCTSGTAATYFHGAVMEADLSSIPLLVLTADRPPELHGIGANQTVEQSGMYGAAVRWAPSIETPTAGPDQVASWRSLVVEAAAHALGQHGNSAGPVHLNLPLRDPLLPTADGVGFAFDLGLDADAAAAFPPSATTASETPRELSERISAARRGVIVAGGWTAGPGGEVLNEIAANLRWPMIAEPYSNARRGAMALRSTDALLRDDSFVAEHEPDLIVVVGRIGLSRALLSWLGDRRHIVVSPDGGNWDVTGAADAVVHCDVASLAAIMTVPAEPGWAKAWLSASTTVSDQIDAMLDASPVLTEPQVARDVAALVPDGASLVGSSSMPIRDLDLVMRPRDGVTIHANRGVSGIDGFVSTVQGIAIAGGGGPTVALCGDLSLLHDVNGLIPSSRPRPQVTYVVINNDGGGIFSLLPQGSAVEPSAFEQLFGTPHGLSIELIAAAYDVPYLHVATAADLAEALSTYEGIRIVEVKTDRTGNAELHDRLRTITAPPPDRRTP